MPSLDARTTVWIAALICGVFALAGLVISPMHGNRSFTARVTLANGAMFFALVLRASSQAPVGNYLYAAIWTVWSLATLSFVSALREATDQPSRDREHLLLTAVSGLILTCTAAASDAPQPVAIMASITVAGASAVGFAAIGRLHEDYLQRTRLWLLATFGIGIVASLAVIPLRVAELRDGTHVIGSNPLIYLSLLLLWISANVGMSMTIYLRTHERIRELSRRDDLTGALNRRGMGQALDERRRRTAGSLTGALVLVDIDHFKRINDTHGHSRGDAVLQWFADELRRHLRTGDLLVRLGGEEFALVLPDCVQRDAIDVAERVCLAFDQQARFGQGHEALRVTASFGVAAFDGSEASLDAFLRRADEALYTAKRSGRNRVIAWAPEAVAATHPFGVEAPVNLPTA